MQIADCPDTTVTQAPLTSRDPGVSDSECDSLLGVEAADTVLAWLSPVSSKVTQPLPRTLWLVSVSPMSLMSLVSLLPAPPLAAY